MFCMKKKKNLEVLCRRILIWCARHTENNVMFVDDCAYEILEDIKSLVTRLSTSECNIKVASHLGHDHNIIPFTVGDCSSKFLFSESNN